MLHTDKANTIIALMLGIVLIASGCAVQKKMEELDYKKISNSEFSNSGAIKSPDKWWLTFNDKNLDSLVEKALTNNLTIRQAWSRLDQFKAVARLSGASYLPQIDASAAGQRQRSGEQGFVPSTFERAKTIDTFNISATVSYQVDLWDQIGAAHQADLLNIEAGRKDVEATAVAIVSTVVDLHYSIAEQKAALQLLQEQLEVNNELLKLVELRFSNGLATAVDVYQQRLALEGLRNQIPQVETTLKVLQNQLSVILGELPDYIKDIKATSLPELPEIPVTGIPADVLRRRPDIKSAELRVYAADRRLAVAVADKFPKLSLSSSVGGNSNDASELFERWFINLAGNILGPIFDGGRREAEVERNRAVVEEQLLGWEQKMLVAIREVEDALDTEAGQLKVLQSVEKQIYLAGKTLQQARSRYANGLIDYINVLTSLQALQRLERTQLQIKRQIISNRIKLYVALGGHWTEELREPHNDPAVINEGE